MNDGINPFLTEGYISKEYFCDREYEIKILKKNIKNGIKTTIISNRRLGKSALIHRLFEELDGKNYACIYIDIYACTHLKDFTEILALSVFTKFPQKRGIGFRFFDFLKNLRPIISYDTLNGRPEIRFEFSQPKEYEHTLQNIFQFIDNQQIEVVLAIDEFQQIGEFPEKNVEALLRTIIQTLKHTHFIFSGSKKHMMFEMFHTTKRPFFSSTQTINLSEIPADQYKAFIREQFAKHKRTIDDEAIDFILSWTLLHTYYTQTICNGVFASGKRNADIETVKRVCDEQLTLQHTTFMQYRSLLSHVQWQLMLGIAREGLVTEPHGHGFLQKNKIGAASSVQKALKALLDKEMILSVETMGKTAYRVYNVFLMRWMERTFK